MGLLTIIRKNRLKAQEMRILFLYVFSDPPVFIYTEPDCYVLVASIMPVKRPY